MTQFVNVSRRDFIKGSSALVLGFSLSGYSIPAPTETAAMGADSTGKSEDLTCWIRIEPNGTATVRVGASEMGQGVYTALPMLLAEELDLAWEQVRVESAPVENEYRRDSFSFPGKVRLTGGSESIRGYWTILREAGATARAMLVGAAADRWGVDPSACSTNAGVVTSGAKSATYAELVADAAQRRPPGRVELKDPAQFRLIGTSPNRIDLPDKVDGKAMFGTDTQVEGMVNATIRMCPHYGGTLVEFNDTAARAVNGVIDIFALEEHQAIVVVADTWFHAKKAAALLTVTWDAGEGAGLDDAKIESVLKDSALNKSTTRFRHGGRPEGTTVEAVYQVPYIDHAPIEPMAATAWVQEDRVDVWAPTQAQNRVQKRTAKSTGLPKSKVFVHTTLLGGGFGRKGFDEFTDQVVVISKRVGRPVKLTWTREETFGRGHYRPAVWMRQRGAFGDDGIPTDYHVEIASQNIMEGLLPGALLGLTPVVNTVIHGLSEAPYAIERQQVDYARVQLPIPVGWWRSVHGSHNGFFRECFLDEMIHAAGKDPIEVRRALLKDSPRHLAVFELAVDKAGPVPEGMSRGVAHFESFGSIVAEVADVTVVDGVLKVHRITAAVDCGIVVHPDIVRSQIMGGAIMGLSSMYEGLTWKDGAAQERNYHQSPLLKMAQSPEVDVHIVPSAEPPGGVGEVGLPPALGAVGNAIFAATGKRIRKLPLGDQLKA